MSVDKKLKNTLYDKEERYKWKGVPVMDNSIEIKKLNKFYGRKKQALSNVSLTIGQGMFGLLGRKREGRVQAGTVEGTVRVNVDFQFGRI